MNEMIVNDSGMIVIATVTMNTVNNSWDGNEMPKTPSNSNLIKKNYSSILHQDEQDVDEDTMKF